MAVTLQDIAKNTKYSIATVSRVLNSANNSSNSRSAELIRKTAKELNYRPHFGAQVLAKGKSSHVAVIVPEIEVTYTTFLMKLESALAKLNLNTIPISTHWTAQKEAQTLQKLPVGLDKVINLHYWESNVELYKELASQGYRQIFYVLENPIENVDFDCIGTNAGMGTYHLFKHMWSKGYRKIGVIGGFCAEEVAAGDYKRVQSQGYKKAHDELGIDVVNQRAIPCKTAHIDTYEAVDSALSNRKDLFDAFILHSNDQIVGTYKALEKHNLKVPNDIAVATFGDVHSPFAELYDVTIWACFIDRICQGMISLLKNHILKESAPVQKMFYESILLERKSTNRKP